MFLLEPPVPKRLLELCRDKRSEVSSLAMERLTEQVKRDPEILELVFQATVDDRLGVRGLSILMAAPEGITPERLQALLVWFDSPSAAVREAIVPLIRPAYMTPGEVAAWADKLQADEDEHVREAGHRIARTLPGQTPKQNAVIELRPADIASQSDVHDH